ncbi:MAG: bifunctional phosphoribosylaminoimidazolecarboxamide formyltransferase/IMP cyclohydrolase [Deltaproteobacteria bacterium]
MLKIQRALISVSDKTGITEFARGLADRGVEIISTGGTAKMLKAAGVPVVEISDYTGFPEMMDGRVKTLHPKIHGGLLSVRDNPDHMREAREHQIGMIDMVVVNLYPFEETIRREKATLADAIENIDIGGPSMLRSAAKNYRSVAVVPDPKFYGLIHEALARHDGCVPDGLLEEMAVEVFKSTAHYDSVIAGYLQNKLGRETPARLAELPQIFSVTLMQTASLRYGENPHQKAALYRLPEALSPHFLVNARQLHGKELSFNNYLDLNAALALVREFERPAACVVKHNNPTGVAENARLSAALRQAWATDPLSAFGGIIGCNRVVDAAAARVILQSGFCECVLAPGFSAEALTLLKAKKNLRLLELPVADAPQRDPFDFKKIDGGILIQEEDDRDFKKGALRAVTRRRPTKAQSAALLFAWKVVRHVKSNAIVLATGTRTVGIGMGQTSRVDSVRLAVRRAGKRARGAVLASDAFLPKADNIAVARRGGIAAVIQPGGSIADPAVIRAADRAGMAMVFTGFRHFKH